MVSDCIFCKIVNKEIPSEVVYEDQELIAFKDIAPFAPLHLLVVPKKHIKDLNEVAAEDLGLIGRLLGTAQKLAAAHGVAESGYRVITNIGADGGQVVPHLHFHILGGQKLGSKLA